ncbi:MAG: hypothetical protein H6Q67_1499 [Firmicutes bacterium]|nr:hypothetical protein [Bacillota bacterium]
MYKEARNVADEFSRICREVPNSVKFYEEEISICDKALCDVRHYAELNKTNRAMNGKLVKALREYSKRRRTASDNLCVLKPLGEFIKANGVVLNKLDQVRGEMRKEALYVDGNRNYKPRVLEALFEGR